MDLSSSLSGTKEFRIVKRGYDPDEVDAFLDQIALGVAELKRKLAETADRAGQRPAPVPAAAPAADPSAKAQEIDRALILALRAADDEVRKATEEGERILAEANQRADELRREADQDVARRREEGKAGVLAEIRELERERDALSSDVVVLERHVDEQREVVQAAIGELQTLLDHPEAFRIAAVTGVTTTPAPLTGDDDGPSVARAEPEVDVRDELPGKTDLSRALSAIGEDDAAPGEPSAPPAPVAPTFAPDDRDLGPPTEAVPPVVADGGPDEDAFLAELRKAMLDDEPLGAGDDTPGDEGRGAKPRFGRRR